VLVVEEYKRRRNLPITCNSYVKSKPWAASKMLTALLIYIARPRSGEKVFKNLSKGEDMKPFKVFLREDEVPRQWYNIQADLPTPLQPIIHPATGKPIGPEDLAPVFPMNLIEQEVSHQRWIDIPEAVLEKLLIWRPSPLQRAYALEKALDTPARIYYKNEGMSPPGSHKPNTAVPQAYYNKVFASTHYNETGAGQWVAPSVSPAVSLAWSARFTWSGSAMIRSLIAAS
jgi:hypothetical protein